MDYTWNTQNFAKMKTGFESPVVGMHHCQRPRLSPICCRNTALSSQAGKAPAEWEA